MNEQPRPGTDGALRRLVDGDTAALGAWCAIPSALSAEALGRAGYDWICIDMQHGLVGYDQAAHMLQALTATPTPVIVRVPWNTPGDIMRALDAGAQGVLVPMVNSPAEASLAAGACRYPPYGYRSWGPIRPSLIRPDFAPGVGNQQVVCLVMVETPQGLGRVDEIVAVAGVDGIFIGPNDLAISAGLPLPADADEAQQNEQEERIQAILVACRRAGKVAGITCAGPAATTRRISEGFRLLSLPSDLALLSEGSRQMLGAARSRTLVEGGEVSEL